MIPTQSLFAKTLYRDVLRLWLFEYLCSRVTSKRINISTIHHKMTGEGAARCVRFNHLRNP